MKVNNRWHSFILAEKEQSRSIWHHQQMLMILCQDLGLEYRLEKAETLPGVDPEYVIHRQLPDGYDIEIMIQGNYRHRHYMVSLWAENGRYRLKTICDLFFRQLPAAIDELIRECIPDHCKC